jgi:hypothetical protein
MTQRRLKAGSRVLLAMAAASVIAHITLISLLVV